VHARTDVLVLEPGAPSWPARLDTIEGPPERLWVRGRIGQLVHAPLVALVGTRAPTPYGEAQAARFARALAAAGVGVVSGLARGVDQAAHRAALDAGGVTLAVLGCGVDRPWPAGELAERVAREGALVSELEPGTPPRRHHFPRRNRLISGLADAVLVVEAAFASGSLITARWAADQGRSVLAVPGRVDHPMARGCHRLLREGALFAEDPEDVLAELGLEAQQGDPGPGPRGGAAAPAGEPLLAALRGETLHAEELAARTGTALADVLTRLVELELAGAVARAPGGLWRLG
jgi:DNA processing protein